MSSGPIGQVPARQGKGRGCDFQRGHWEGVGHPRRPPRLPGIGWLGPPLPSLFGVREQHKLLPSLWPHHDRLHSSQGRLETALS